MSWAAFHSLDCLQPPHATHTHTSFLVTLYFTSDIQDRLNYLKLQQAGRHFLNNRLFLPAASATRRAMLPSHPGQLLLSSRVSVHRGPSSKKPLCSLIMDWAPFLGDQRPLCFLGWWCLTLWIVKSFCPSSLSPVDEESPATVTLPGSHLAQPAWPHPAGCSRGPGALARAPAFLLLSWPCSQSDGSHPLRA